MTILETGRRQAPPRWLARRLLLRIGANVRRSVRQREVAVHGACLLVLTVLVAFAPSSSLSLLVALGMLWGLDPDRRRESGPVNANEVLVSSAPTRNEESPCK